MDIVSDCGMSVSKGSKNSPNSKDLNPSCKQSAGPSMLAAETAGDLSLSDLGSCLSEFPSGQDEQKLKSERLEVLNYEDTQRISTDDPHETSSQSEADSAAANKRLTKSVTFPSYRNTQSSPPPFVSEGDQDGNCDAKADVFFEDGPSKAVSQPCPRSLSLPNSRKVVSAMKGSREKQGLPPMKFNVKWAPDVHDPPPTSVSHVPSNKNQRQRTDGRKRGKSKNKGGGKSSRNNKGKDKKQAKKRVGSSNGCFKTLEEDDTDSNNDESHADLFDFDVGSRDPFCGRSFLKKSIAKMHFPVAEAT